MVYSVCSTYTVRHNQARRSTHNDIGCRGELTVFVGDPFNDR